MDRRPGVADWLLLLSLAFVWGASFILMKKGMASFRADQVAALRLCITGLVFFPFAVSRRKEIQKARVPMIFVQGIFGNFLPAFLFTAAETKLSSITAGILNSLSPVWVFVIGIFFFKSKYDWVKLGGICMAFAGVVLLIAFQQDEGNQGQWWHAALVVAATLCYGIAPNITKVNLHDVRPLDIAATAFSIILIPSAIYLLATGIIETIQTQPHAAASLGYTALLAIGGSAIASVWFNRLIHNTSALFAASVSYLIPVAAVCWGLLGGEQPTWLDFTGMVFILFGVYLVSRR